MNVKLISSLMCALALGCSATKNCCVNRCANDCANANPVVGNWGARLPYTAHSAAHFIIERDQDGKAKAQVLMRWASPMWCSDVVIDGNKFSMRHPYGYLLRGKVCGSRMYGELAYCDKDGKATSEYLRFEGWRNPPIKPANTKDAKFGEPIDLLKDGMNGWMAMDQNKNCWSFKDGVLSNRVPKKPDGHVQYSGANLMTTRSDFYDFNLEYDVRVPKGANSGVYLRGRYEIQTLDSFGKKVDCHHMAAYYGRVAPSVAVEKPAGEWQHVSITLYKRHLTIVLNGTTILDNVPVVGVTGGAIDAHEFVPGPLYIQGDHSDADYRNMILRKAL